MDRRSFFRTAATILLVVGRRANAAAPPRVAFVHNNAPISEVADDRNYKAFARGLRERGFEEGRNIIVVRLSAEGRYDRFPQLMEELVATSVDVIVAIGPGVGAAKRATRTIRRTACPISATIASRNPAMTRETTDPALVQRYQRERTALPALQRLGIV